MTNTNTALKISLGITVGCCILLLTFMILYGWVKRRNFQILKEKYFRVHVGTMRTFTLEELQNATNGFHESARIGGGVYRGELPDKSVVAVKVYYKKEITVDEVNQVIALSQINHKNVVRLLGICSQSILSPIILVYEYIISNGNLYEHIHGRNRRPLSADTRMKAAAETAAALACLHSSISNSKPVITHKNVKATNILFDDNYMVKLSGFEFSFHKRDLSMGYLDPEHIQSSKRTEKSDVYSFGVVLAELLTSKRAFDFGRSEAQRMLANMFASAVEAGRLHQILDDELVKEGNIEMVKQVADLANRCMRKRGEERPSMKEVAMELEGLRIMAKHPGGMPNLPGSSKETDPLVTPPEAYVIDVRGEGFDGGRSSTRTNAEEMGYRRLQEVDYYLT